MESALDFEVFASKLKAESTDIAAFVKTLAHMLETSLPAYTTVIKQKGLFAAKETIKEIKVELGEVILHLNMRGSRVDLFKGKSVRGIVLKTEPVSMEEFIHHLVDGIKAVSQKSEEVARSLQGFIFG